MTTPTDNSQAATGSLPRKQSNNNRLRPMAALKAVRELVRDPEDTRKVFEVLEAFSGRSLERGLARFRKTPVGERVLDAGPGTLLDLLKNREYLRSLPADSLGRAYLRFVETEQITADGLVDASEPEQQEIQDPELRAYGERIRDMHDLWHVSTQYGRDTFGEVCLLAFTYAQTRNPGIALICLFGAVEESKELGRGVWGAVWNAFCDGRRAQWLPAADWEALLAQPLESVREQLGITAPAAYQELNAALQPA